MSVGSGSDSAGLVVVVAVFLSLLECYKKF